MARSLLTPKVIFRIFVPGKTPLCEYVKRRFFVFSMKGNGEIETLRAAVTTVPADLLTPLAVYLKLAKHAERAFLLESVEGSSSLARYSFIGAGPKFTARCNGG